MSKKIRMHTHPKMEQNLGVPHDHCIIDGDLYLELVSYHNGYFTPPDLASQQADTADMRQIDKD